MRDFHKSWFSTWISETISSICKLLWKDSRFYPHRGDLALRCVSCWLHPCSHFLRFDDSNFYPCWTVTFIHNFFNKKTGAKIAPGRRDMTMRWPFRSHGMSGGHTGPPGHILCPGVRHSSTTAIAAQQPNQRFQHEYGLLPQKHTNKVGLCG